VNRHPLKIFENPDPEVLLKILKEPELEVLRFSNFQKNWHRRCFDS
jgi:hypothetical protein